MRALVIGILVGFVAASVSASLVVDYSWEDGNTILGSYGNVASADNVASGTDPNGTILAPSDGTGMLQLTEDPLSSTPQAYVAWIKGLNDGDEVTVSVDSWCANVGTFPRGRVWGHYTVDTIDSYGGSASGPTTYADTVAGWDQASHTWTYDATVNGGDVNGLMVEYRLYSSEGNSIFFADNMTVTAPDQAIIQTPGGVVPEPATLALLGLAGLAAIRRRR